MAPSDEQASAAPAALPEDRLPCAPGFWGRVARFLVDCHPDGRCQVLVPHPAHAELLRSALREAAHTCRRVPRIATLSQLVEAHLAFGGTPTSTVERRIELFAALKQLDWTAQMAGGDSAIWALARRVIALCDELTLGLAVLPSESVDSVGERILAVLRGAYAASAWQACSVEAELVLSVWRATLTTDDGCARTLRALEEIADSASLPLLVVCEVNPARHECAFYERYRRRSPVRLLRADLTGGPDRQALLAAAWPELYGGSELSFRERAQLLGARAQAVAQLALRHASVLEDEAQAGARAVLEWLDAGSTRIAIVALDRVVTRRIRALLERAEVLVRDEAGWKLSTTTVAGVLMRWLDLVALGEQNCRVSDLLDWLKSPHVFAHFVHKQQALAALELALRRLRVTRGSAAIREALAHERRRLAVSELSETARAVRLAELERAVQLSEAVWQLMQKGAARRTLAEHFTWLADSTAQTGMAQSFAGDIVGVQLLQLIAQLSAGLGQANATRFGFGQWCDFLGEALEETSFRDSSIDSPVSILTLPGAVLRDYDAVLIAGASRDHLPLRNPASLFLTPGLRGQLGLSDQAREQHDELARLALILLNTPRLLVTWHAAEEAQRELAAPLARLAIMHREALAVDLQQAIDIPSTLVLAHEPLLPRPAAPGLLPERVSPTHYSSLVACAYQFYARRMLGLSALDDLSDEPGAAEFGLAVHRILERLHGHEAQTRAQWLALLQEISEATFDEMVGDNPAFLGQRKRWSQLIEPYIDWWLHWRDEGWRPAAREQFKERSVALGEHGQILLYGRIDRLDERGRELAIIDYKTSDPTTLKRSLKSAGEEVQLPLYRALVPTSESVGAHYLSLHGGEVRRIDPYYPIDILSTSVLERLARDFTRIAAGAGLPALGNDRACKYCEMRGLCRRGQWERADAGEHV